jgi:hypothetical protein
VASERDAAPQRAKEDQDANDLAEFELNADLDDIEEETERSDVDREAQDKALDEMEESMDAVIEDMDDAI